MIKKKFLTSVIGRCQDSEDDVTQNSSTEIARHIIIIKRHFPFLIRTSHFLLYFFTPSSLTSNLPRDTPSPPLKNIWTTALLTSDDSDNSINSPAIPPADCI